MAAADLIPPGGGEVIGDAPDRRVEILCDSEWLNATLSRFAPGRAGHWQFDLEGYVAKRLAAAGVAQVERLGLDTYDQPDRFFSYRRDGAGIGECGIDHRR